ncbi:TPM domain-containing protein [Aneurinibacillus aneurinilyticus]|uniref:TPM domain-containing protein n=1 Tax=Aneurinibacillus aneurinilyticus TaxID=1391 RepID=UPI003672687F
MKRAMRLFLCIFVLALAFPGITAAADIPAKKGLVQDIAKMLPKETIPQIEKAAKGEPYTFYVLTVNSLDGEEPSDYATMVYNEWNLGTDDILLLISKQERRIEMNFNNATLQEKIDALPDNMDTGGMTDSKLSQFVDAHFIPEAKKGDFAKASIELMKATYALKPIVPAVDDDVKTGMEPDENNTSAVETPLPQIPLAKQETPEPAMGTPINWSLVIGIVIGLLLLAALAELIFRVVRLHRLQKRLPGLMVQVNQASESIKPYIDLSQDKTLQMAMSIDKQLTDTLLRMNNLKQELSLIRVRHWLLPGLRKQLKGAVGALAEMAEYTAQLTKQITHIEEVDRNLKQLMADAEGRLNEVALAIEKEQTNRGWPLGELVQRQRILKSQLEESRQMSTFDPLGAEERFNHANEALLQMEQDVASIDFYSNSYRDFPNEMAACRQHFEHIVQEHRLKLVRIEPYENVEQAHAVSEQMYKHLQNGDIPAVIQHVERMRQLLSEAVQMTQRQADLKIKNTNDIELVISKLAAYPEQDTGLIAVTERVRPLYRTKHWEQMWHAYRDKLPCIEDISRSLRQVQQWCAEEVQEYELAREEMDRILHALGELDECIDNYRQRIRELDSALDEAKREQSAAEAAYAKGQTTISSNGLVQQWNLQRNNLAKLQSSLRQLFAEPPYDMKLISEMSQQFVDEAERFLSEVERAAIYKRNAEREIEQAESRFYSVQARARRKINVNSYSSQYSSISSEIAQLMQQGAYEQAARSAAMLTGIVTAMNQAYDEAIREEQRQEQLRNSSHSSGGSSWGNSSNSSGGSNWNNNNNNSSGGSNW